MGGAVLVLIGVVACWRAAAASSTSDPAAEFSPELGAVEFTTLSTPRGSNAYFHFAADASADDKVELQLAAVRLDAP